MSSSRWDFGDQTLTTLAQNTSGSQDELGDLIKQLIDAAEPLSGKFNGSGKAAYDSFKSRADQITALTMAARLAPRTWRRSACPNVSTRWT